MAAIIAQITKANWERKKRRKGYFPGEKSVYSLPPFAVRFDPDCHNAFRRRRREYIQRHKEEHEEAEVMAIFAQLSKEAEKDMEQSVPVMVKLVRALLGTVLLAMPISLLLFLFLTFWTLKDIKK